MVFSKGDVVQLKFPYTDRSASTIRPALVISNITGVNHIFMQITSKVKRSKYRIEIDNSNDFDSGKLYMPSCAHIDIIFTGHVSLVKQKYGSLKPDKYNVIMNELLKFLKP